MHTTPGTPSRTARVRAGPARFVRLAPTGSGTAVLLVGCPVVTASGEQIGIVDHLMVDVLTHQLRFVVLERKKYHALVTIPWQALYFDAGQGRLVFYTLE
jgi:hypothetical protein